MYEFIGVVTTLFVLAYLMRGAYFVYQDAQKLHEEAQQSQEWKQKQKSLSDKDYIAWRKEQNAKLVKQHEKHKKSKK
jgi:hypothetical protein